MMKKKLNGAARTHFEQIPLEVVKRIAETDLSKNEKTGPDNLIAEPVSRKKEPNRAPMPSRDRRRR
jgi:hypothetical protein